MRSILFVPSSLRSGLLSALFSGLLSGLLSGTLLCGTALAETSFTGKVVSVADGDTIQVLRQGRAEKVRLWGVDAPEREQDFYRVSRTFTSENAFGKEVTVIVRDHDQYGRTVGVVLLDNALNLNQEIVRAGLAWWYRQYAPDDAALKALETEAQTARRGLWSMPGPTPPWEFRRARKNP